VTRAEGIAEAVEELGLLGGRAAVAGDYRAWCDPIYGWQDGT
jgi:hypothetical protein